MPAPATSTAKEIEMAEFRFWTRLLARLAKHDPNHEVRAYAAQVLRDMTEPKVLVDECLEPLVFLPDSSLTPTEGYIRRAAQRARLLHATQPPKEN